MNKQKWWPKWLMNQNQPSSLKQRGVGERHRLGVQLTWLFIWSGDWQQHIQDIPLWIGCLGNQSLSQAPALPKKNNNRSQCQRLHYNTVLGIWEIRHFSPHSQVQDLPVELGVPRNNCIQWRTHHREGRSKKSPLVGSNPRGCNRKAKCWRKSPFANQQATEHVGKWKGKSVPSRKKKIMFKIKEE